jgi:hypothetical protein
LKKDWNGNINKKKYRNINKMEENKKNSIYQIFENNGMEARGESTKTGLNMMSCSGQLCIFMHKPFWETGAPPRKLTESLS